MTPPASPTNNLPSSTTGSINNDDDSDNDNDLPKANRLTKLFILPSPNHSPPRNNTSTTMATSKMSVSPNLSNSKDKKISATTFTAISTPVDNSSSDPWDTRRHV
ncbi:5555_t:CDS:1 [Ambispora gerdemannii]|uniref:5555_t:CDS:1 n=1 Tax=Ambispora gerdemannii TaxID=144530 RepID=A0A9N9C6Z9_9GLOM|nr:5555_t:CDS:1 [Ambispora gerdemannii]